MKPHLLIALLASLLVFSQQSIAAFEPVIETEHMRVYSTEGKFETYREALEMAITNRGIVINNVAYIGNMLKRTAADVGGKPLYEEGEALEFCSAVISRNMMVADIHNIVFCPYIVAVYVTADEPGTVYVSYRRPIPVGDDASKESLAAVEELLEEIVHETLDAF